MPKINVRLAQDLIRINNNIVNKIELPAVNKLAHFFDSHLVSGEQISSQKYLADLNNALAEVARARSQLAEMAIYVAGIDSLQNDLSELKALHLSTEKTEDHDSSVSTSPYWQYVGTFVETDWQGPFRVYDHKSNISREQAQEALRLLQVPNDTVREQSSTQKILKKVKTNVTHHDWKSDHQEFMTKTDQQTPALSPTEKKKIEEISQRREVLSAIKIIVERYLEKLKSFLQNHHLINSNSIFEKSLSHFRHYKTGGFLFNENQIIHTSDDRYLTPAELKDYLKTNAGNPAIKYSHIETADYRKQFIKNCHSVIYDVAFNMLNHPAQYGELSLGETDELQKKVAETLENFEKDLGWSAKATKEEGTPSAFRPR